MTNIIKFQSPFERIKEYNTDSNIALIKAIILQAVIDATNVSDNKIMRKYEVNAKNWLYGGVEDFESLCGLINYEPSYIKEIARNLSKLHQERNKNFIKNKRKKSDKNMSIWNINKSRDISSIKI